MIGVGRDYFKCAVFYVRDCYCGTFIGMCERMWNSKRKDKNELLNLI